MAGPLPLLSEEPAYQKLQQFYNAHGKDINMKELFARDTNRFKKYR